MARSIITGIDVGTYSIKVVIANAREKTDRGLPRIMAAVMSESKGLRHGYITNVQDVAESIRRAIAIAEEKAGVKVKKAFIGVGGIGLASTSVSSLIFPNYENNVKKIFPKPTSPTAASFTIFLFNTK